MENTLNKSVIKLTLDYTEARNEEKLDYEYRAVNAIKTANEFINLKELIIKFN